MSAKKNGNIESVKSTEIPIPVPKPILGTPPAFATEITPEMAVKWLEKNEINRRLSTSSIENWADVMKRKQWELNGETIIIGDTGDVLDGQHRLWACVESNTSFESYVVIGMSKEVFDTIDTGKKRSGADALHIRNKMKGVESKYEGAIMAAIVTCLEYKMGVWKARHSHVITNQDKIDFLEKNPGIASWVLKARVPRKKTWENTYAANIGAITYLGSKKYPMKAETFVAGFITGNDLPVNSPILNLRQRLGTEKQLKKWDRLKLIIYAWNLHVENTGKLMLRMPAEVPIIAGTEPPVRLKAEATPKKRITVLNKGTQTVKHIGK
jgi:hypothetical protein